MRVFSARHLAILTLGCASLQQAVALNPQRSFWQYSRNVWNQQQGLPQDTITTISQTTDGYLWLGTDEGLARFDGYEFVMFTSAKGELPANSIKALAAGPDGSLWIGTSSGLAQFIGKSRRLYTIANGLPNNAIDNWQAMLKK